MAEQMIKVDYEVLRAKAGEIDALAEDYQNLYNEVNNMVRGLVDNQIWVSDDSIAYRDKVSEFVNTDFQKMHQEMIEYATHLRNSATNYENAKNSNVTKVSQMKAHYNG